MSTYRNVSFATVGICSELMRSGKIVPARGNTETRELTHQLNRLDRPLERFLFVPARRNDVFSQIAEAIWVLSGRDDVAWLSHYLSKARNFSDDGKVWRAGYGPRLRRWAGRVDQVGEVLRLFRQDPGTRRAVMCLFDPAADYVESKDIPCNNWISWILRDGLLDMDVVLRSNDAIWGFSGANAFEWSVLQELMALWIGVEAGKATYFATSLHIYNRHYELAATAVQSFRGLSPYDFGIQRAPLSIPFANWEATLREWFALEESVRTQPDIELPAALLGGDMFLSCCLRLLRLKWGERVWSTERLAQELGALPEYDITAAGYEYFLRKTPKLRGTISHPNIAAFFLEQEKSVENADSDMRAAILRLHARKNRAYGDAWKKRGERLSILPNLARKVDRLAEFRKSGTLLIDESILDTVIDLLVYIEKYRLYLAESLPPQSLLPIGAPEPYSDHGLNFETLINRCVFTPSSNNVTVMIDNVVNHFESLWPKVEAGIGTDEKRQLAAVFADSAIALLNSVAGADPMSTEKFARAELQTS